MNKKETYTEYSVLEQIKNRWSPVRFADKKIEKEKMMKLYEAAKWAASCYNEQPWMFVQIEKDESEYFEKIIGCLAEGNKNWASNAPVIVIGLAKKSFSHNGKPNNHSWYDLGQAISNLSIQATDEGLFLHQMAGFDKEKTEDLFNVDKNYDAVVVFAVGYLDENNNDEDLLKRDNLPRKRKSVNEILRINKFN